MPRLKCLHPGQLGISVADLLRIRDPIEVGLRVGGGVLRAQGGGPFFGDDASLSHPIR